jgi:hypothetical protein
LRGEEEEEEEEENGWDDVSNEDTMCYNDQVNYMGIGWNLYKLQ